MHLDGDSTEEPKALGDQLAPRGAKVSGGRKPKPEQEVQRSSAKMFHFGE